MDISLVAAALTSIAGSLHAPISFSGTAYSQDFNSLANVPATLIPWANDSTLAGWSLFHRTSATDLTPVPTTTYNATDGSNNTGAFISFGTASDADRAFGGTASGGAYFGSPASGAVAGWIAVAFTNSIGYTLTDLTIGFDGEQWRNGGNASSQNMVLEYGYGATFNAVTTWTAPGGAFTWASVVNTTVAAAVNGNVAGLVAGRGGTLTGQNWLNGDTLWFRWIENNDAGNDHGLAIDNVSFNATPTPGAATLLGLGLLASNRRRRA